MAKFLGLLPFEFLRRHARQLEGRWSLAEVAGEHGLDCVFLRRESGTGRASCSIHPVRPAQCRTWPFWPENLTSRRRWHRVGRGCTGVARGDTGEGTLHDRVAIERARDATPPD